MRSVPLLATLTLTVCSPLPNESTTAQSSSTGAPSSWATSESTTSESTTGEPTPTTGGTDTSTSTGQATTIATDESTTGPVMGEDEALLRRAIAGQVDPDEALRTIAGRGGLPVETLDGDYLFACLCGPGDWALTATTTAGSTAPCRPPARCGGSRPRYLPPRAASSTSSTNPTPTPSRTCGSPTRSGAARATTTTAATRWSAPAPLTSSAGTAWRAPACSHATWRSWSPTTAPSRTPSTSMRPEPLRSRGHQRRLEAARERPTRPPCGGYRQLRCGAPRRVHPLEDQRVGEVAVLFAAQRRALRDRRVQDESGLAKGRVPNAPVSPMLLLVGGQVTEELSDLEYVPREGGAKPTETRMVDRKYTFFSAEAAWDCAAVAAEIEGLKLPKGQVGAAACVPAGVRGRCTVVDLEGA